jgi:hypothetical protein
MRGLEEQEEGGEEEKRRGGGEVIQSTCDERGGASCIRIKGGEEGGLRARPCDACL